MWPVSDSEEEEEESDSDSDSESSVASNRGDSKPAARSEGEESGVDMEVDQEHNAPPKHQGGQIEIDQEQDVPLEPEGAEEIQPEKNGQPEHQVAEQMEVETENNAQPEPKVAEVESGVPAGSPQPETNAPPKHQLAEPMEVEMDKNAQPEPKVAEVESGEAARSPQPEKNAPPQPQVAEPMEVEREENAPEMESGVAVGSPHQEPPTAQAQNAAYGDQSGQEASTKVASTSKSILTSSTKRKTLAKAKRKPPETDSIDFGEETKNTKRLKQQASRAATDRGRGRGRSRGGGSARGRGASARRSGRGG